MFWHPDANDPPIVEGQRFIDITTGCGSIRGLSRDVSYFLAGVRITEPMTDLVRQKLDGLRLVLSDARCVNAQVARKLGSFLDRADRDFGRGRYADVAVSLQSMADLVVGSPQAFTGCAVNVGGEIRARAQSAIYAISKIR